MRNFKFLTLIVLASFMLFSPIIAEAAVIAKVVALSQGVVIERNGNQIDVQVEDNIHDNDTIITDGTGKVQIMFKDHTFASLSTNTIFAMSDFNFSQNDASFTANMTKGFARFVTGKIVEANPDAFKVITPEATVGIRGTTFSVYTMDRLTTVSTENSFKVNSVVVNNTVIPVGTQATFGPNAQLVIPPTPMTPENRQELVDRVTIAFAPSAVSPASTDPNRIPVYDADAVVSQELPFVLEGQNSIAQSPESSAGRADSSESGTFNPNLIPGGATGGGSSLTSGIAGFAPGTALSSDAQVELGVSYDDGNSTILTDGYLKFKVDLTTGGITEAEAKLPNVLTGAVETVNTKGTGVISGTSYTLGGSDWKDNTGANDYTSGWNSSGNLNVPANTADGTLTFNPSPGGTFNGNITGINDYDD